MKTWLAKATLKKKDTWIALKFNIYYKIINSNFNNNYDNKFIICDVSSMLQNNTTHHILCIIYKPGINTYF